MADQLISLADRASYSLEVHLFFIVMYEHVFKFLHVSLYVHIWLLSSYLPLLVPHILFRYIYTFFFYLYVQIRIDTCTCTFFFFVRFFICIHFFICTYKYVLIHVHVSKYIYV